MQKCKFGGSCKSCNYLLYKLCPMFKKNYIHYLLEDILPITKIQSDSSPITKGYGYSTKRMLLLNKIAKYALSLKMKVLRFNMNQAVSLVTSDMEFPLGNIVFVDCTTFSDNEKMIAALLSFYDKCKLLEIPCFLYIPNTVKLNLQEPCYD